MICSVDKIVSRRYGLRRTSDTHFVGITIHQQAYLISTLAQMNYITTVTFHHFYDVKCGMIALYMCRNRLIHHDTFILGP